MPTPSPTVEDQIKCVHPSFYFDGKNDVCVKCGLKVESKPLGKEDTITASTVEVSQELRERFEEKFWYLNNDTLHEKHGEGCKCRSAHMENILSFIAQREALAREEERERMLKKIESSMIERYDTKPSGAISHYEKQIKAQLVIEILDLFLSPSKNITH